MKRWFVHISLLFFTVLTLNLYSQDDCIYPLPPVLTSVSVQPETNITELNWTTSPSSNVIAYLVFEYHNEGGIPRGDIVDTIWNPSATSYSYYSTAPGYFSVSYVVSALGVPDCESPFSNALSTIHTEARIDTCNKMIAASWNSYPSVPRSVQSYSVLISVNGGSLTEAANVTPVTNSFILYDFTLNSDYCFVVRANLEGGKLSTSNKVCLQTKMQRPPQWINADYATIVPEDEILLSFHIDPSSEIRKFILERKEGSDGSFSQIYQFSSILGSVLYGDSKADLSKVNYYRLSAINNCNLPITISNLASNIVLSLDRNDDDIALSWNPYKEWKGAVGDYKIHVMTGGIMEERYSVGPVDTVFHISYSSLMYEISLKEACFQIRAVESANPYGINGESRSSVVCTPVSEVITVPNLFTPDNNGINDLFRPVLSFTPLDYQLIITDINRRTIFETRDHSESWDGTLGGDHLPEGVYMWFLRMRTPSGRAIDRAGTVTIKLSR